MSTADIDLASYHTSGSGKHSLKNKQLVGYPNVFSVLIGHLKTSSEQVSLLDNYTLSFNTTGYYFQQATVKVKFECPVRRVTVLLYNVTLGTVLASQEAGQKETVTLVSNGTLEAGTQLQVLVAGLPSAGMVKKICLTGQISLNSLREKLRLVTNFDQSWFSRYLPDRPNNAFLENDDLYNPQFPTGHQFPWATNVIPWQLNQPPSGLTAPIPAVSAPHDKYGKFQSIQYSIGFYLGLDFATISPNDPQLSVFLTSLENRGTSAAGNNYRKKIYLTALTCNLMTKYAEKVDTYVNRIYSSLVTYSQPLLSSAVDALVNFFLSLHVGYDNYPDYVVKYFRGFVDVIGFGDPCRAGRDEAMLYANENVDRVREYFAERGSLINQTKDDTCLIYYWHLAGLDPQGLVMEAIHNIIAFNQFTNVIYLIVNDQYGTGTLTPLPLPNPYVRYNFLDRIRGIPVNPADPIVEPTPEQKLNIVREVYRLLVPNTASFSAVTQADDGTSQPSTVLTPENAPDFHANYDAYHPCADIDPTVTRIQARHVHKSIMATQPFYSGNPNFPLGYFTYQPNIYSAAVGGFDYLTSFDQCAEGEPLVPENPVDNINPDDLFMISPVDGETVLDKANPKFIPVYSTANYTPFGLGYRRCPGEVLTYFITMKLMDKIKDLQFEFCAGTFPRVALAPFTDHPDNIFALGACPQ